MTNKFLKMAQAAQQEGVLRDMTETTSGGGRLLPEGMALAILTGYVESGLQPQVFQGKAKAPAREFKLQFHLVGFGGKTQEGTREEYVLDGVAPRVSTFWTTLNSNERSNSVKMFNAMNWMRDCTSFAEMLGRLFVLPITHKEGKNSSGKPVIHANIDVAGITPPTDPRTGQPYEPDVEVPESEYQLFLWDAPNMDMWDSIYIDGTTDEGKSKNYLQEHLLESLDYEGSGLQELLEAAPPAPPKAKAPAPATAKATPKAAKAASAIPDPDEDEEE